MTAPPLPSSPVMRVRLDYTQTDEDFGGSRFYLGYTGAAPTAGNCATLASDIAAAWATNIASSVHEAFALTEVDVIDIATVTGASGQWEGSDAGAGTGALIPASAAFNCEFDIARRYRGGKPRIFQPPPDGSQMQDGGHWTTGFVASATAGWVAFFAEIAALSIGAIGTLSHVNVSYYSGFTNVTNSSGRTRAAPKYRSTALVEPVNGYAGKLMIGSQRRRRAASTY